MPLEQSRSQKNNQQPILHLTPISSQQQQSSMTLAKDKNNGDGDSPYRKPSWYNGLLQDGYYLSQVHTTCEGSWGGCDGCLSREPVRSARSSITTQAQISVYAKGAPESFLKGSETENWLPLLQLQQFDGQPRTTTRLRPNSCMSCQVFFAITALSRFLTGKSSSRWACKDCLDVDPREGIQ
jgi:hypothetical protein